MLGTPALFATAYGNVGSSIYYALGLTAVYALGLTPLVFLIAGIVFAMTAATYAEGTVLYPEAGGSSSFARHGFNEIDQLRRRVGADARLRRHRRDLGLLRPALPLDLLGAAEDEPVGHRRRRDRDRGARDAQRGRRAGGGAALDRARRDRLRDAGAARPARPRSSSSARRSSSTTSTGASRRRGRTSRSRFRSRCSPTPASRPSPTSPRRRASRRGAFPTPTSSSPPRSSPST